jgi:hypothetical protein
MKCMGSHVLLAHGHSLSPFHKPGAACRYLGSFKTAEEAARAFDQKAVESGRPVETLNFPAMYGGPTVGQAYRKRKVHRLYGDPQNHVNVLLQKLGDVDRSNPGILRLTMGTLGVPECRFLVSSALSLLHNTCLWTCVCLKHSLSLV